MSEKELDLEKILPVELQEIIKELYDKAQYEGDSINVSEIEEILDDKEEFDQLAVLVALISKNLSLKKIKVIDDVNEEEDYDGSNEGTEDE